MVPAPDQIAAREGRELFSVHKPSTAAVGIFGLAMIQAADLAGVIPDGRAAGAALALSSVALFAKACVRIKR